MEPKELNESNDSEYMKKLLREKDAEISLLREKASIAFYSKNDRLETKEFNESLEKIIREKDSEISILREKERVAFYSEVRQSLAEIRNSLGETNKSVSNVQNWITVMGDTKEIKSTLDDYKVFKAQIKTGLIIMNVLWGIIVVLVNWFLKK